MKNKKIIAVVAGLAALTVAGGSFAAFAADNEPTDDYSYATGQENGAKYAEADEDTDKTDYSYVTGRANGSQYADAEGAPDEADKTDFSFNAGKVGRKQRTPEVESEMSEDKEVESESPENAEVESERSEGSEIEREQPEDTEAESERSEGSEVEREQPEDTEVESGKSENSEAERERPENDEVENEGSEDAETERDRPEDPEIERDKPEDTDDRSYNAGQKNAQSRNGVYEDLPEGGAKEDAETFYEQNDVGGGAWVNGAYDGSAKTGYGYVQGQQRGSSYAQETDGEDTPDKSGYSYSTGRQSYEQDHATWTWGE